MKRIRLLFTAFTCIALLYACNKQLNLTPENTLVDYEVFETETGTEQALAEVYYNFFQAATNNIAYTYGDFTTANLKHSFFYDTYNKGNVSPEDIPVRSVWQAYYKAINLANNLIAKVSQYSEYDAMKQEQFIAEAKFIRAFAYLDLLKLFGDGALTGKMDGMGVPLQLTPFEGYDTGDVIPRSGNDEVYAQIIKDLEEALPALPAQYENELKTRSRATKGAASALLSRTYLYMHEYEKAATASKAVLDKQPAIYSLSTDLKDLFPPNPDGEAITMSTEYIFGFPISHMISSFTKANNHLANGYFFKRSFWINPDFIGQFKPGDLRVDQLMFKGDTIFNVERLNDLTTFKFNNRSGRDNVPMIRLAEVILTRSESLARMQGVNQESVDLLNEIRNRSLPDISPYAISDFSDKETLIATILSERRFELAFEGLYRYDLIRTGKPSHSNNLPENKWVLPIPQIEIDIGDGVIVQNPGYN